MGATTAPPQQDSRTRTRELGLIVALPVLVVFFVLQKQFVSGLTLGSTKG
jgi:ABC-type maltose transport system permease subunit